MRGGRVASAVNKIGAIGGLPSNGVLTKSHLHL